MNKRNTKSRGRARGRRAPAPKVLDRHDEAGIAEFFDAHGMALMPRAQMLAECKARLNDVMAVTICDTDCESWRTLFRCRVRGRLCTRTHPAFLAGTAGRGADCGADRDAYHAGRGHSRGAVDSPAALRAAHAVCTTRGWFRRAGSAAWRGIRRRARAAGVDDRRVLRKPGPGGGNGVLRHARGLCRHAAPCCPEARPFIHA